MKILSYILFIISIGINFSEAALPLKYIGLGNIIKNREVLFYETAADKTNNVNGTSTITTRQPIVVTDKAFFKPSIGANSTRVNSTQGLIVGFIESTGYDNPNSGTYKVSYKCIGFRPNLVGVSPTKSARELSGNMMTFAPSYPGTYYMFITNASMIKATALANISTICQAHNTSQLAQEMVVDLRNIENGDPFNLNPASANANSQRVFTGDSNKITVVPPSCIAETASQLLWPTSASYPAPGTSVTPTGCSNGVITGSPQRYCIDNGDGTASWGPISGGVCAAQCVSTQVGPSLSHLTLPLPTSSTTGTIYSFKAGDPGACSPNTLRLPKSISVRCTNNGPAGNANGATWVVTSGTTGTVCRAPISHTATVNSLRPSNPTTYSNPHATLGFSPVTWNSHTATYPRIGIINNMYLATDPTGTGIVPNDGDEITRLYDLSGFDRHIDLGAGVYWRNNANGGYLDLNKVVVSNTAIASQNLYMSANLRFMMFGNFVVLQDPVLNNGAPNTEWNFATMRAGNLMMGFGYNRYGFSNYHPKLWYWGPSAFNQGVANCGINLDYPSGFPLNYPMVIGSKDNSAVNRLIIAGSPVSRYASWVVAGTGPMQVHVSTPINNVTTVPFFSGPGCPGPANPFTPSHPIGFGAFAGSLILGDRNSKVGIKALILASPNPLIDTYTQTNEVFQGVMRPVESVGWSCTGLHGARITNCGSNNFFAEIQISNEQFMAFTIRRFVKDLFPGTYDSCPFSNPIANAYGPIQGGNICAGF